MKAMVLSNTAPIDQRPLDWRDVDEPTANAGQVVIKVTACGVCRSNLHMVEGEWLPGTPASMPIIPGHEVVGTVTALGQDVTHLTVGERVGVQPIWSTCGRCEFCLSGSEQLCRGRQVTGETRDGGYAELMLAEAAYTYPIPENVSDAEAAPLLCPGITAYSAVKKAALSPGQRVAVLGVGGVGHMVIQVARLTGADVYAVTRSAIRRWPRKWVPYGPTARKAAAPSTSPRPRWTPPSSSRRLPAPSKRRCASPSLEPELFSVSRRPSG